jgi:hypothetical protein
LLVETQTSSLEARKGGTGSAAIRTHQTQSAQPAQISGFVRVSLLSMVFGTGRIPFQASQQSRKFQSLEQIRKTADKPIVVFPECTTSNGRAILQFAPLFAEYKVPVKGFQVFVMCIRSVRVSYQGHKALMHIEDAIHRHNYGKVYRSPSLQQLIRCNIFGDSQVH